MGRKTSDSFVLELPLRTTAADERVLSIRMDAARQIYNATLGECLRILTLMRESRDWQRARSLSKGPERTALFKAINDRFDFKSSMADRFAISCKNGCWIGDHMSSNETQKTALRAFQAVQRYAFGKCGRPSFKRYGELNSIEGKTNKTGIRLKGGRVEWSGLSLQPILGPKDVWQSKALGYPTKFCRLIRRVVRGIERWSVQLIQEGQTPLKHCGAKGIVGLDVGPSTIAMVSSDDAALETLCPTVEHPWRQIRQIERAMDRSRRATNPDNFNPNGTVRTGKKKWARSRRYQRLAMKRREQERRLAAERKRSHGHLCNRILAQGTTVKTEKLSYLGFQKSYGRSAKVHGCGAFIARLRQKAVRAGGEVIEFSTRTTRLSQFDHTTADYVKKPLSQRIHYLRDGSGTVQRDLYSAFLARFVSQDKLDARQAYLAFPDAKPLLLRAASSQCQPAIGVGFPAPNGPKAVRAGRPYKEGKIIVETADDVPVGRNQPGGLRRDDMAANTTDATPPEPTGLIRGEV